MGRPSSLRNSEIVYSERLREFLRKRFLPNSFYKKDGSILLSTTDAYSEPPRYDCPLSVSPRTILPRTI
jgi:hypothetical protein